MCLPIYFASYLPSVMKSLCSWSRTEPITGSTANYYWVAPIYPETVYRPTRACGATSLREVPGRCITSYKANTYRSVGTNGAFEVAVRHGTGSWLGIGLAMVGNRLTTTRTQKHYSIPVDALSGLIRLEPHRHSSQLPHYPGQPNHHDSLD